MRDPTAKPLGGTLRDMSEVAAPCPYRGGGRLTGEAFDPPSRGPGFLGRVVRLEKL
jgi:hypothetical protein